MFNLFTSLYMSCVYINTKHQQSIYNTKHSACSINSYPPTPTSASVRALQVVFEQSHIPTNSPVIDSIDAVNTSYAPCPLTDLLILPTLKYECDDKLSHTIR